jgi:hypothetical protein
MRLCMDLKINRKAVNLLYVDTDGFVMKIQTDDLHKDLKALVNYQVKLV